jgi:nitroreductase
MEAVMEKLIQEIQQALNWRYATKVFDPDKKISSKEWDLLEDSLVLAPSSYGLQPWKFLVVENKEIREKLKSVSWNQGQVTAASHFVVFTTLKKMNSDYIKSFIELNMRVRDVAHSSLAGYENMMNKNIVDGMGQEKILQWNQRQSYIAMGFLLETAALLKIDTVPLEGLDPAAYDKILGIDQSDYGTVAAVALGYRSTEDKYQHAKKVRFSKSEIIQKI